MIGEAIEQIDRLHYRQACLLDGLITVCIFKPQFKPRLLIDAV